MKNNSFEAKNGHKALGYLIFVVLAVSLLIPAYANKLSDGSGSKKIIEICREDVDGEYDLILMSLDEGLDHLESHSGDHLAVDGQCDIW